MVTTPPSATSDRISTSGSSAAGEGPLRYDERPVDDTPVSTEDLPATPIRDRNIPATAWREAPDALLHAGDDLPGAPVAEYKRRIGDWLLWRAGPASGGDARYLAIRATDLTDARAFRLYPDGTGDDGDGRTRFREWKQHLLGRGEDDVDQVS